MPASLGPRSAAPAIDARRLRLNLLGSHEVFSAFSFLFNAAAGALNTQDLAALGAAHATLAPTAVGWVTPHWWEAALGHCRGLAQRIERHRYRWRHPERARLLELAGDGALADPRRVFCLSLALERAFTSFGSDYLRMPAPPTIVLPVPRAWFADTTTKPPPIGQMTPVAICRRWLLNFWFVGKIESLRTFGEMPRLSAAPVPARTAQALEQADSDGVLRIGLAQWPEFETSQLVARAEAGCFSVSGYHEAVDEADVVKMLETARDERIHLLVGPELAVTASAFNRVREHLGSTKARYPVLSVWGRTHLPRAIGGFSNVGVVLDSWGNTLHEHEKLEAFTHPALGVEDIIPRESREYRFLDSPIGRLVVNVCRDVRSDLPEPVNVNETTSFRI